MKNIFYEILARLGFWIPCDKYLPNKKYWDWVLISYHEHKLTYRYIPEVAEYSYITNKWHDMSDNGNEEFLNNICKITHWRKIPNDKYLKIKNS